jgi:hypothetical protein
MKRVCLSNLQYLLLALLLMAMMGCGATNSAINADNGAGAGSITAKLVIGKGAAAKALANALPSGISSLQFTVTGTDPNGKAIPVVRNTITQTDANGKGSVTGIYPGTVTVSVKALNGASVVYEGFALNVKVVASSTPSDAGTIVMSAPLTKDQDANCVSCHETTLDASGQNLVADFKQSGHYTNLAWTANDKFGVVGTGCAGCHGPSHNDTNPSASGRCLECHGPVLNPVHFTTLSSATAHQAEYVATNYKNNCSACHEPHNPIGGVGMAERQAWAQSAHGDVNGAAWSSEDMQAPTQAACQRCHTATGFKIFVQSNLQTFPTVSAFGATDKAREVLACNACHSNDNFDVRPAGSFTAQYTIGGKAAAFPDAGESNLCIACHSARENGVDAVTNFANASFKNSHYLPAAGLMYMSTGFTQFTSANAAMIVSGKASTYGKSLTADNVSVPAYGISGGVSSTHRKLGTPMITGDTHNPAVFIAGQFDKNGPCVTCHMNANGAPAGVRAAHGHTLEIDGNTYNQVCTNCHGSENTVPLTAANFKTVFVEPQSEAYQAALTLAVTVLKNKTGIEYDSAAYPYFFKGGLSHVSANAVKDWTLGTGDQVFGKKLMGACFNIQLLTKDPAAYAHARSYSRRLLYDTIDFLDDGAINLSVGATALNVLPSLFTKGTQAYNAASGAITTIYPGTSEGMLYLIGWDRTTGVWTSPERP